MTIRELQIFRTRVTTLRNDCTVIIRDPRNSEYEATKACERLNGYCYVIDSLNQLEKILKLQEEGVQE